MREITRGEKTILPILYGDITDKEVSDYSASLANKYWLRASDFNIDQLVVEILRVVKPPTERAVAEAQTGTVSVTASAYVVNRPGVPSDALPRQDHLLPFQPCLTVVFGGIQSNGPDRKFTLSWTVRNIGQGPARKVRIFIPGLTTYTCRGPIEPNHEDHGGIIYQDLECFTQPMKPPVHLIAEYEDLAGNLYRQYGNVIQSPVPSGAFFKYEVEELGTPYLVADRIVKTP